MSGVKYWFSKISYSIADKFTNFFFGFATYLLLVRNFSKAEFGVYTLFIVIVSFLEIARSAFMGSTTMATTWRSTKLTIDATISSASKSQALSAARFGWVSKVLTVSPTHR